MNVTDEGGWPSDWTYDKWLRIDGKYVVALASATSLFLEKGKDVHMFNVSVCNEHNGIVKIDFSQKRKMLGGGWVCYVNSKSGAIINEHFTR